MSVLTLADAKSDLGITSVDAARDVRLQAVIDGAEATLADKVGPLASTAQSERIRSYPGARALALEGKPVISLTTVTAVKSGTVIATADLHIDARSGLVSYDDGYTTFTEELYDVTYQAGHSPLPADLLEGIKALVRHRWTPQRGPVKPGTIITRVEPDPDDDDHLPAIVADLIDRYAFVEQGFA